jgi:predicted SprT family Zn-dependent metalloprotease
MESDLIECQHCAATLQRTRIEAEAKKGERAFCPHCMNTLAHRDGKFTLQYKLLKVPTPTN